MASKMDDDDARLQARKQLKTLELKDKPTDDVA
jgi:hypothetical protein